MYEGHFVMMFYLLIVLFPIITILALHSLKVKVKSTIVVAIMIAVALVTIFLWAMFTACIGGGCPQSYALLLIPGIAIWLEITLLYLLIKSAYLRLKPKERVKEKSKKLKREFMVGSAWKYPPWREYFKPDKTKIKLTIILTIIGIIISLILFYLFPLPAIIIVAFGWKLFIIIILLAVLLSIVSAYLTSCLIIFSYNRYRKHKEIPVNIPIIIILTIMALIMLPLFGLGYISHIAVYKIYIVVLVIILVLTIAYYIRKGYYIRIGKK